MGITVRIISLLPLALLADCATAPPEPNWHKANAVQNELDRAKAACMGEASKAWMSGPVTGGYFGALGRREDARAVYVGCMAERGWDR